MAESDSSRYVINEFSYDKCIVHASMHGESKSICMDSYMKRLESMPSHIIGLTCSYTRTVKSETRREGRSSQRLVNDVSERVF